MWRGDVRHERETLARTRAVTTRPPRAPGRSAAAAAPAAAAAVSAMAPAIKVGSYVRFKDTPGASGVVFEFQDDGMVAGLKDVSEKLKAMGIEEQTHEPVENLEAASEVAIGDRVYFASDGPDFTGTVFEFQDDGMVAGLMDLSDKLAGLGCALALPCVCRPLSRSLAPCSRPTGRIRRTSLSRI